MNIKGLNKKVLSCIRLSSNYIQIEEVEMCFWYCCPFPEDRDIKAELLVIYLMGEELAGNVKTVDEGKEKVHAVINNLKASCLFASCL